MAGAFLLPEFRESLWDPKPKKGLPDFLPDVCKPDEKFYQAFSSGCMAIKILCAKYICTQYFYLICLFLNFCKLSAEKMVSTQETDSRCQDQKGRLLEKQPNYHAKSQAKQHKTK
jgi:hypothetical protein